jgi:hypothetical protein
MDNLLKSNQTLVHLSPSLVGMFDKCYRFTGVHSIANYVEHCSGLERFEKLIRQVGED